jgi:succinate-acetate transporter protein
LTDEPTRMWFSMLLAAAFLAVGVVLVVVGGWFGFLVGAVALLMGLVLLLRGYRLRSARA